MCIDCFLLPIPNVIEASDGQRNNTTSLYLEYFKRNETMFLLYVKLISFVVEETYKIQRV